MTTPARSSIFSLFQTVRFKNEKVRNITIKLGYANAKVRSFQNFKQWWFQISGLFYLFGYKATCFSVSKLTPVTSVSYETDFFLSKGLKVKVSHSLIGVGAVGLESHCILGTADEKQSPSFSFPCLILP